MATFCDYKRWLRQCCEDAEEQGVSEEEICLCLLEQVLVYMVKTIPKQKMEMAKKGGKS